MIFIRIFVIGVLITTLCGIHILQLGSLLIKPFSNKTFRRTNSKLAAFWWFLLVISLERLCNVSLEISGKPPKSLRQSALVISNHQSLIDPLIILILAKGMNSLSFLKWFAKHSLVYIPFLGWGLWFLDCIFLKRRWEEDQSKISDSFFGIQSHQDPLWLISFVEGTRQTKKNLLQCQQFASQRGFEPFKKVLFPRHKGFAATIEGLGSRIQVIYNLTIQYEHSNPSLIRLIKGDLGRVHLLFEEFEIPSLPKSREDLRDWLIGIFRKKDALLQEMRSNIQS